MIWDASGPDRTLSAKTLTGKPTVMDRTAMRPRTRSPVSDLAGHQDVLRDGGPPGLSM